MKTWWSAMLLSIVAIAAGMPGYGLLNYQAAIPLWLRDHPWPMELISVAATLALIALLRAAYRERARRAVTTIAFVPALLSTGVLLLFLHVAAHTLPAPPAELGVGKLAADFTLPDQDGNSFALSSLRGQKTLLVFYRGYW